MRDTIDLLFIHVPKSSSYYPPYGEYMTVNLLPMGTFALADLAVRTGYRTEILHLGLEWIEQRGFSPVPYLCEKKVEVVAIPLHWHEQSYEVMRTAQAVKEISPQSYVVLGGYTASFFHQEILDLFPQIDAVIRGDAEVPLMALMEAVDEKRRYEDVPNLTWRDRGEIKENPLRYVATERDLECASYANLQLLRGYETYIRYMGLPFVWAKRIPKEQNRRHFHLGYSVFPLAVGRGCTGNCTWCGGGAEAQRMVNGRRGVIFRAPERVADTVSEAAHGGYEMVHIAFDPGREAEPYYQELFSFLRKKGIGVRCYFESFSLPSETFLQSFARTFVLDGSVLALSPESGEEWVRSRNKTFSFSNEALMRTISTAEGLRIRADIFFAMGIPGEWYPDLARTVALRREIQRRFKNIGRIWTSSVSLEPASPWHLHPEEFGIISTRRSFADFYRASSPGGGGLGYFIPDYLGNGRALTPHEFEVTLKDAKCREHCSLHPDPRKTSRPFWGRVYCHYRRWRLRGSHGEGLYRGRDPQGGGAISRGLLHH